jgi:hypothetical protein
MESLLVKRFGPRAGYLYIWIGGPLVALGIFAYGGRAILEAYERGRPEGLSRVPARRLASPIVEVDHRLARQDDSKRRSFSCG